MHYAVSWRKALEWAIENAPSADYRDTFSRIYNANCRRKKQPMTADSGDVVSKYLTPRDHKNIEVGLMLDDLRAEVEMQRELAADNNSDCEQRSEQKFYRWNPETKKCE